MMVAGTNFNTLFSVLDHLIDDRVGVIRHLGEVLIEAGAPEFFHFFAQPCDTRAFSDQQNFVEAGGASAHRETAMAKAIGEAIERYCSAIYEQKDFPLEKFESACFQCIPPEEFALYSPEQIRQSGFPYTKFNRTTPVRWTKAIDAATGEEWHVPASMIYAPYFYDPDIGEHPISQPISTGLACHCTYTEAAISALCEVIERDAFTITWQAMVPAPPIRLNTLSEENRDLVARFESRGGSVRILNITLDHGIPSIMSILMHESEELPAFAFAAASHLSPEIAIRKSLEELAHTRRLAVYLQRQPHHPTRKQDVHVRIYTHRASRAAVEFLLRSEGWIDFHDLPNLLTDNQEKNLEILCTQIRSVGAKPLVTDLTSPDIRELGLTVIRAVLPGFHPLFMGHNNRALGGWRLWNVPQAIGYEGVRKETGDNPAPHPFP